MATKQIWFNLPSKDIKRSRQFFTDIGFQINEQYGNSDNSACFLIGEKKVVMMLFEETMFRSFTQHDVTDTSRSVEVLFSIDAESREAVDEMAKKVTDAGGTVFSQPRESQGWMYGFGFSDMDGHRWNVLYMDMSKMSA